MRSIYFTLEEEKEMIQAVKNKFPETEKMNFHFEGNHLYANTCYDGLDMLKICTWLYDEYNLEVYTIKTVEYKKVLARSEQESKDIIDFTDRKHHIIEDVRKEKYSDCNIWSIDLL